MTLYYDINGMNEHFMEYNIISTGETTKGLKEVRIKSFDSFRLCLIQLLVFRCDSKFK